MVKYLNGIPENSRGAANGSSMLPGFLAAENIERVRALNLIAARLEDNLQAVHAPELSADELNEIEAYAVDLGLNLWRRSSES